MSLGPVMFDLQSTTLTDQETEMLLHPQAGGVILFTRNFSSVGQLRELVTEIHSLREPHLLVAVDHEGGRVQRFKDGFTHLPAAIKFGEHYQRDQKQARRLAALAGWLMARELRAVGIDFSFAPVLDLAHGVSGVIGDRAFHRDPEVVADLAQQVMLGMRRGGMEAVGKHFPGHGGVKEDSHTALPVDQRRTEDILAEDVLPFERMIHYGLAGIMPAHVIYADADPHPAGYSQFWLRDVLRERLGFHGAVFSDDLSMEAAHIVGDVPHRAHAALEAGCDMVVVCNHPEGAVAALEALGDYESNAAHARLARFHGRRVEGYAQLRKSEEWHQAVAEITPLLDDSPWLELRV